MISRRLTSAITINFLQARCCLSLNVLSQRNVDFCNEQKFNKRFYWKYAQNAKHIKLSCNRQLFTEKFCKKHLATGPFLKNFKKRMWSIYQKFDIWIEHASPSAKHYLDMFTNGAKATWSDIQTYRNVSNRLKINPNATVSYSDAMKIHMVKRDAIKVAPLLPFCFIPFGFVMLVIPAYLFPRYILPHAFWSDSQRKSFYMQFHQGRLQSFDIVLHHMRYHRENTSDFALQCILQNICSTIEKKDVPSNKLLLQLKPFCTDSRSPFNIEIKQVNLLLRSFSKVILANSMLPSTLLLSQLKNYSLLIMQLDEKLRSEHLISELSVKEVETAAIMRGLNSANLPCAANIYWMRNWLELTKYCDTTDYWFVLHAMVLLSTNYSEIKFKRKVLG